METNVPRLMSGTDHMMRSRLWLSALLFPGHAPPRRGHARRSRGPAPEVVRMAEAPCDFCLVRETVLYDHASCRLQTSDHRWRSSRRSVKSPRLRPAGPRPRVADALCPNPPREHTSTPATSNAAATRATTGCGKPKAAWSAPGPAPSPTEAHRGAYPPSRPALSPPSRRGAGSGPASRRSTRRRARPACR